MSGAFGLAPRPTLKQPVHLFACACVHIYTQAAQTVSGHSAGEPASVPSAPQPQVLILFCRTKARQMHVHRKLNGLVTEHSGRRGGWVGGCGGHSRD